MNIRHDRYDLLERLLKDNGGSGISLHVEHKISGLPTIDFYSSFDGLLTQKKKIQPSSIKLQWGHQIPLFMTTIPEDKFVAFLCLFSCCLLIWIVRIPKVISSLAGTFIRGTITFPKNEKMKKLVWKQMKNRDSKFSFVFPIGNE